MSHPKHKLYMAPLQSYTTMFYRAAHHHTFGTVDKYFTPFFEEGKNSQPEPPLLKDLLPDFNQGMNVVPQVATNNPTFLVEFAHKMAKSGFQEININMGCPFPMLVKRQKGGGLMAQPQLVEDVLNAIEKAKLPIEVSVKIRAGLDHPEQGLQLIETLNKHHLTEVIIHPRLVTQKYNGLPDWDAFGAMLNTCKHPVVANGDLFSYADYQQLTDLFPSLDCFMLGRGLLTHPSLSHEIKGMPFDTNKSLFDLHNYFFKIIQKHFKDWHQGFYHLINFWHYPLNQSTDRKRLYRKLKKHNTPDLYSEWLKKVTDNIIR